MSVIFLFLIVSMLIVLWFDSTRYIIPNWLVGMMLLVYPIAVFMAKNPIEWYWALAGAVAVLLVGYIIFMKRFMGGGDIKLLFACALWVGHLELLNYLLLVGVLGGLLAVIILICRHIAPYVRLKWKSEKPFPRIFQNKEPVPYGIAIAIAFLIMMWLNKIPVLA